MRVPSRPAFLAELDPLSWWLAVLLGAEVAVAPLNGVLGYLRLRTAHVALTIDTRPGAPPPSAGWFRGLEAGPLALPAGLLSVALIVLWLVWQHRATSRLWAYGLSGLRVTPGWSVGWWFVPFANLVMPFVAMRELDLRSSPEARRRGPVLWAWWICYRVLPLAVLAVWGVALAHVLIDFIDEVGGRPGVATLDLSSALHRMAGASLVSGVLTAASAALGLTIVVGIERSQARLASNAVTAPSRPDLAPAIGPGALPAGNVANVNVGVGSVGAWHPPPRRLGFAVTVLLAIQFVALDLAAIGSLAHLALSLRIERGTPVAGVDLQRVRSVADGATGVWFLALLVTAVTWLVWQHHAQQVVRRLTLDGTRFTPGWAVGWWFVPIAALFQPYRAVRELWKGSHGGPEALTQTRTWWVLKVWWATWLGLWALALTSPSTATTPHELVVHDVWFAGSFVLAAVSAACAIAIVRSVGRLQAEHVAPSPAPAPPVGSVAGAGWIPPRPG